MTHIAENLSVFFNGFEADCVSAGHNFKALFHEPQVMESFEDADLIANERTLHAQTADVQAANIQTGSTVAVTWQGSSRSYKVKYTRRGGDSALTRIVLGASV